MAEPSAPTPGQAAYEAHDAVLGEIEGYTPGELPSIAWNHLPDAEQRAFDAAAQAAIDCYNDNRADWPNEADLAQITSRHVSQQAQADAARMWRDAFGTEP